MIFNVVIPAGGKGKRMNLGFPKQMYEIDGFPIIYYTIKRFLQMREIKKIYIAMGKDYINEITSLFPEEGRRLVFCSPGEERRDSVYNALCSIVPVEGYVLIHDAARPFVSEELIKAIMEEVEKKQAVIPVLPLKDTVKRIENSKIAETLKRSELCLAQTPQAFEINLIKNALENSFHGDEIITDDAMAVELTGNMVYTVPGDENNVKITTPDDLKFFKEGKHV